MTTGPATPMDEKPVPIPGELPPSVASGWKRNAWKIAKWVVLLATLAFAARALQGYWGEVRSVASEIRISWGWVILGSAIVLLTHASLVQSWRLLLAGWDRAPTFWSSVRIWTISIFGKYVPGKVWSIGAMSLMARREGVSGVAAASSAILGTLLNIGAGFGIVAISGANVLTVLHPSFGLLALIGSLLFLVGVLALPWLLPPVVDWLASRRGLPPLGRHVSARRLWSVTALNFASWIGYGLAFAAFSRGVTPDIGTHMGAWFSGAGVAFITVYTASYICGYLFLFAPGGFGVREGALVALMVGLRMTDIPEATVLAVASRVWITVLEITPALIALSWSRKPEAQRSPSA